LNLEDNFQGDSQYNVGAEFLMTEIDDLGAERRRTADRQRPEITSEFYQPLDALRIWFVAPSARIERGSADLREQSRSRDFRDREVEGDSTSAGISATGRNPRRLPPHQRLDVRPVRKARFVQPQYNNGEYFFKFSYDQLDNVHFPREARHSTCNGMRTAPISAPMPPSTRCRSTG